MPRKKVTKEDETPPTPKEEQTEPKAKRNSSRKKTETAAPTPESVAPSPAEQEPKRVSARRKAAPEPSEPERTPRPSKGKRAQPQEDAVRAVASEIPEAASKPSRRNSKKAQEPAVDPEEELSVSFRKPARAASVEAAVAAEIPQADVKSKPRRGRGRGGAVEAEIAETTPPATEAARQASPPRRGGGKRAKPDAELVTLFTEAEIPMLTWRPRQAPPAVTKSAPAAEEAEAEAQLAPRRSRRRRRRDQQDVELTVTPTPAAKEEQTGRGARGRTPKRAEAKAEPPRVEQPQPPVKEPKPLIPTPEDAPQIVLRDGIPTLVRDHRVYPPVAFFGSSSDERRAATVVDEMRMAGEAGVHLHSHLVEFEVDPRSVEGAVAFAAYMLNKSIEADPEAQVLFRLVFIAPAGWQDKYPNAKYQTADGLLAEPSLSDEIFWSDAKDCLESFVEQVRMLDKRDHILGVHLERGEWFFAQGVGYDTSSAAKDKFREWCRSRYGNDIVALRAAWFDGSAQFNNLQIPPYRPEEEGGEKFVRANRKERRWVDYHLFLSDMTVERIGDLAYTAKEASEGYFLVGISYGYTFEWSHPASGHLSLGKLLRHPEVDFIAGPPSYRTREPGGAAAFPCPIDSFALNGKLYISEEDFKTSIGGRDEPDDFNPVIKTPQALESVHWRGAGSALSHASGVCWMDLWGNGWLKTPSIWDRAKKVMDCLVNRMCCPMQDPDVAVFIDERALAYLVDPQAFTLLVQNVREAVLRSGLNAAFYLLSDLQHREKFPESKLYLFLNAWDVRPELRAAIKQRLQRDGKVLFWLYAAGLFDSGRESLERAREVTGIALKPQPFHSRSGTTILNRRHPLCDAIPDRSLSTPTNLEPSYFAIPEEAIVLGEYTQTGLPSFVVRDFQHEHDHSLDWKSVFLGEPIVTPALLRALGQMAGAHIWNYKDDVVHVRPPFLTVHCTGAGPRTVTLPNKWSAYNLLSNEWVGMDSTSLRFNGSDGATYLFLVGPREELEQVLTTEPADVLRMAQLPPKPENTIRFDAFSFDIPIVKLDEWMGADAEDISEDFLFRPKLLEEEQAEEERQVRRRRRRGRRGGDREQEAPKRTGGEHVLEDRDLDVSVVFRKRE